MFRGGLIGSGIGLWALAALAACEGLPLIGSLFAEPDAGPTEIPADDAARDAGAIAEPDVGYTVLPTAALYQVEPASGGASVAIDVVLRGEGLPAVAAVWVGGQEATRVVQLDSRKVTARFEPVPLTRRGKKLVAVVFANGMAALLPDGFEYLFDEDPVVFVHGFSGGAFHWGVMLDRFREAGYPDRSLWALSYDDPFGSSLPNVGQLSAYVAQVLNQTGAAKVDMVVHSMGGISSRMYIRGGGFAFVRDYMSIAGAHHGTYSAFLSWSDGAAEMRPPYACQGESLHDLQYQLNGCLTETGRTVFADETPYGVEDGGGIAYRTLYSGQDEIVLPAESGCLNQARRNDCDDPINEKISWLGHGSILLEQGVFERTLAHLRRRNPSKP